MTNAHCFSQDTELPIPQSFTFDPALVPGTRAVFNFERGAINLNQETYDCGVLVAVDRLLDVVILNCRPGPIGAANPRLPGNRWGFTRSATTEPPAPGSPLYVIHQNCVDALTAPFTNAGCTPFKKISPGLVLASDSLDLLDSSFRHDADTMPGSSGAPVFSAATHLVIGLNKCCTDRASGAALAPGNRATKISAMSNLIASMTIIGGNRPGLLPDLTIQSLRIDPLARVRLVVGNIGAAVARNFQVRCFLTGIGVVSRTIPQLRPARTATLNFTALIDRCIVDPQSLVFPSGRTFESRENNNERTVEPVLVLSERLTALTYQPMHVEELRIHLAAPNMLEVAVAATSVAGVVVELFDLAGRQILVREAKGSRLSVQLEEVLGRPLANGVYFYRVTVQGQQAETFQSALRKLFVVQ